MAGDAETRPRPPFTDRVPPASGVTGQAAALYDVSRTANTDITRIVPVAVLVIAILLGLVPRSLAPGQ